MHAFFQMYFVTRENQAMEHQDGPFFFFIHLLRILAFTLTLK